MARPPKKPELRMDKNVIINVTTEQRATINAGAAAAGRDMSAWARPILLQAAKRELAKHETETPDK